MQLIADAFDAVNQRSGHVALLEMGRHARHEIFPECFADALVNCIVAVDGKPPRFWRNQKNDGVPVRMMMQFGLVQMLARGLQRVGRVVRNYPDRNAPGRAALGGVNRRSDAIAVDLVHLKRDFGRSLGSRLGLEV